MHNMTVKSCREKVIVSWFYHILKTLHLQQLKNKRYTKKGVPFLSKMVSKRARGWTILGRSLHEWNFVGTPPPGSSGGLGSNELHDSSIVPAFALLLNMTAQFFMTVYPTCTFPVSYRQCKRGQCVSFFPCFSYEEALVKRQVLSPCQEEDKSWRITFSRKF